MQQIGIMRPIDRMGRVVIPKEIRKYLGLTEDKDHIEIFLKGDEIVMRKFDPRCAFCGNWTDGVCLQGIEVCFDCIEKLKDSKEQAIEQKAAELEAERNKNTF